MSRISNFVYDFFILHHCLYAEFIWLSIIPDSPENHNQIFNALIINKHMCCVRSSFRPFFPVNATKKEKSQNSSIFSFLLRKYSNLSQSKRKYHLQLQQYHFFHFYLLKPKKSHCYMNLATEWKQTNEKSRLFLYLFRANDTRRYHVFWDDIEHKDFLLFNFYIIFISWYNFFSCSCHRFY